jgi:hypothetical protein
MPPTAPEIEGTELPAHFPIRQRAQSRNVAECKVSHMDEVADRRTVFRNVFTSIHVRDGLFASEHASDDGQQVGWSAAGSLTEYAGSVATDRVEVS